MDLCSCPTPNKRKSLSFYESKCISTNIGLVCAPLFSLFPTLFKDGSTEYTLAKKMKPRASGHKQRCNLGHYAALCILNKHLIFNFSIFFRILLNGSACIIELVRIKLCNVVRVKCLAHSFVQVFEETKIAF